MPLEVNRVKIFKERVMCGDYFSVEDKDAIPGLVADLMDRPRPQ